MVACPLQGLVGRPSSLKKAAPLVHLWFAQNHAGFWKATQDPAFHQNEQGYSSAAIGMSQKMMTSLYSQNFEANLSKCQDERLACDSGVS